MGGATDPMEKAVYNGRQLALKVSPYTLSCRANAAELQTSSQGPTITRSIQSYPCTCPFMRAYMCASMRAACFCLCACLCVYARVRVCISPVSLPPADQCQLCVRLHGGHSGQATLPRHLQFRDELRPADDQPDEGGSVASFMPHFVSQCGLVVWAEKVIPCPA